MREYGSTLNQTSMLPTTISVTVRPAAKREILHIGQLAQRRRQAIERLYIFYHLDARGDALRDGLDHLIDATGTDHLALLHNSHRGAEVGKFAQYMGADYNGLAHITEHL